MLKKTTFRNFKIFENQDIDLGLVTLLIGPNSSGKSSILDGLGLLKQSNEEPQLVFNRRYTNVEAFETVINRRVRQRQFSIGVEVAIQGPLDPICDAEECVQQYEATFDDQGLSEHVATLDLGSVAHLVFRTPRQGRGPWNVPHPYQIQGHPEVTFYGSSLIGLPFQYRVQGDDKALHDRFRQLRTGVSDCLEDLAVVPLERTLVRSEYPVLFDRELLPADLMIGDELINYLAYSQVVQEEVSEWLGHLVGYGIRCDTSRKDVIRVEAGPITALQPLANEGAGTRQLLWPLTVLSAVEADAVVMVEEPEIHLHPRAQSGLCSILVETSKRKHVQVVLTTHSEHILVGMLTTVAEGKLPADELAVHYFERTARGESHVTRLPVTNKGTIEGGLKGFFDVELDELDRYMKARLGQT